MFTLKVLIFAHRENISRVLIFAHSQLLFISSVIIFAQAKISKVNFSWENRYFYTFIQYINCLSIFNIKVENIIKRIT